MAITPAEIAETRGMVEEQNLDIRTITMGVSLMGCGDENLDRMCTKIYDHVTHTAEHLVETAENLEDTRHHDAVEFTPNAPPLASRFHRDFTAMSLIFLHPWGIMNWYLLQSPPHHPPT